MLKKTIRRLGALAMVLAMAVSVFAVNASAANNPETVTINKVLTKSAGAPVPNTSFSFKIEAGEAGTYQQDGQSRYCHYPWHGNAECNYWCWRRSCR